jgi:outer membrane lipoprotein SlyB
MKRPLIVVATVACVAVLAACATASPDIVSPYAAQRLSTVIDAVVLSVRPVVIDGTQSGLGAATGAAIGGIAGSSVGGYRDSFAAGIIGAVVGGIVGNTVERGATRQAAVEVVVQLRNGERRSVVQAEGQEIFAPGDPVLLITTGGRTTVTKTPVTLMPVPSASPAAPPAARH